MTAPGAVATPARIATATTGRHLSSRNKVPQRRSRIDAASVRGAITCGALLRANGIDAPERGRIRCPLHHGVDRNFALDERGWRCWSGCGDGGGVIDLAMRLHQLSFREALEHCAEIAGLAPQTVNLRAVRVAKAEQERRQAEREATRSAWVERWIDVVRELDGIRREQWGLEALLRLEFDGHEVTDLLEGIGDPYTSELLVFDRLDQIERDWRAAREGGVS